MQVRDAGARLRRTRRCRARYSRSRSLSRIRGPLGRRLALIVHSCRPRYRLRLSLLPHPHLSLLLSRSLPRPQLLHLPNRRSQLRRTVHRRDLLCLVARILPRVLYGPQRRKRLRPRPHTPPSHLGNAPFTVHLPRAMNPLRQLLLLVGGSVQSST